MKDVNILFDSPMKFEIRDEYYLSGKTGICYGWIYHSQYWAIVVFDGDDDPSMIKLNALKF